VRIELTRKGFADLSLTTWVPRRRPKLALSGQKVHSGQPTRPQMEKSPRGWAFQDIWSGRRGSNPRHRPWQGRALPLSYSRSSPHSTALPPARQFHRTRNEPPLFAVRISSDSQLCDCTAPVPHVLWRGRSASSCPCCCDAPALDDHRVGALPGKPSSQPVANGMKAETSHRLALIVHLAAPFLQHSSKDCRRTDVVPHDHAVEPWLLALFPVAGEEQIPVLCVQYSLFSIMRGNNGKFNQGASAAS
jgi:hypothetical protein